MNPVFIFLVAVIWILSSIASKKKKEEMKKKANQQPPPGSSQNNPGSPKTATVSRPTKPSPTTAPQKSGSAGRGMDSKWPWPTATEKAQNKAKPASGGTYGGTPRYTHVVTSTLEGGHTHTESSMTGEEACPPPKAAAVKPPETGKSSAPETGALLNFQPSSVLQGVLYAEILGKPKSLQRH